MIYGLDVDESIHVSPTPSDASSTQWVPRLRPRSREDSISSLDSSSMNITKELGAVPKPSNF